MVDLSRLEKVKKTLKEAFSLDDTSKISGKVFKNLSEGTKAFSASLKETRHPIKALNAGLAALSTTAKATIGTMAALLAVLAIVKIVDAVTVSLKESRENLASLKQEFADNENELQSLNDELKTTSDRIDELQAKDSLTFTEKEELNNLQQQNAELQRQIDLLELEQKIKNKEKNKSFAETMQKETDHVSIGEYLQTFWANFADSNRQNMKEADSLKTTQDIINQNFAS